MNQYRIQEYFVRKMACESKEYILSIETTRLRGSVGQISWPRPLKTFDPWTSEVGAHQQGVAFKRVDRLQSFGHLRGQSGWCKDIEVVKIFAYRGAPFFDISAIIGAISCSDGGGTLQFWFDVSVK